MFFLGANLFSTGVKLHPSTFMLSNFLYRLASFSGLANSEKYGFNIGFESSLSGVLLVFQKKFEDEVPNNKSELEFGGEVISKTFNANFEFSS